MGRLVRPGGGGVPGRKSGGGYQKKLMTFFFLGGGDNAQIHTPPLREEALDVGPPPLFGRFRTPPGKRDLRFVPPG